jgi:hypothetical protein
MHGIDPSAFTMLGGVQVDPDPTTSHIGGGAG